MMMESFVSLLSAYLLGEFILQPQWMVDRKGSVVMLLWRAGIVTALSTVLLGNGFLPMLSVIFVAYIFLGVIMDTLNTYVLKEDSLKGFLIYQGAHIAVIAVLACLYPTALSKGWWPVLLSRDWRNAWFTTWILLSALIVAVPAGGVLISKIMREVALEMEADAVAGLRNGGKYIGWLERSLVLLLLYMNQPTGIGFLVAAKSILRFGDIRDAGQRRLTEYIIIGTFLRFGWALLVATITQKVFTTLRYSGDTFPNDS